MLHFIPRVSLFFSRKIHTEIHYARDKEQYSTSMSDSNFHKAHQPFKAVLKVVDPAWMGDCLSDDGTSTTTCIYIDTSTVVHTD